MNTRTHMSLFAIRSNILVLTPPLEMRLVRIPEYDHRSENNAAIGGCWVWFSASLIIIFSHADLRYSPPLNSCKPEFKQRLNESLHSINKDGRWRSDRARAFCPGSAHTANAVHACIANAYASSPMLQALTIPVHILVGERDAGSMARAQSNIRKLSSQCASHVALRVPQ
jgi:pimeloyl-ACP methyl ester carboxylesterase